MIKCQSLLWVLILSDTAWISCAQYVKKSALIREKRALIWPQGGSKLLAICGFGIPVDLKPETVIVGMVLKANYRYPTNVSEITDPIVTYQRKKRALNRWDLYALLSQALEMKGFNGKPCLLRTVCEIARTPVVKNFGLFHELIKTFFTPTNTKEKLNQYSDNEYYAAQLLGQKKQNCEKIFSDCTFSLLDLFTTVENIPYL